MILAGLYLQPRNFVSSSAESFSEALNSVLLQIICASARNPSSLGKSLGKTLNWDKGGPQENQANATLGLKSTLSFCGGNCACRHTAPCPGRLSASRPKLPKELVPEIEAKTCFGARQADYREKIPGNY